MGKRIMFWDNARDALLSLVFFLLVLGAVNVFSASYVAAADMFGNGYHYLLRYGIFSLAGLLVMFGIEKKVDYHWLFKYDQIFCVLLTGILIAVDIFGRATKGAQRWVILGPISFQPSEFVKLAVILLGAHYLGQLMEQGKRPHLLRRDTGMAFWETAFLSFLVLIQPDMGTAAIIMTLMIILYILAGLPMKEFWSLLGVAFVGAAAAVIQAPYRLARILFWLHPEQDPQGKGYQAIQSFNAIGSGRFFGEPFGMGTGKFFYLPEAHTDFAFANYCQEWGFLGAVFLILVFLLLGVVLYYIGQRTQDRKGFLLVSGVNFLVVGQAFANMAMVCGVLPIIGVPLSFISYGGTSLIMTMGAIGLVLSVYKDEHKKHRRSREIPAEKPAASRPGVPAARRWRP
ncbi:FtsW/RodA/SpoVE family cell cycle protein [Acidaminococcus timonensis]|jgi:cell division protein FtsW|uniref:FtsW/RodA/SpoVE family cell cycle protein n=1 Tax=Acidaminococcus timonensis TaxID=1871002 RepID=UPI003A5C52CE